MEKIRIECEGAGELALNLLSPLQGELKSLSPENYEKLKKEILVDGFSFPIQVWESPEDAKIYIIDGHQRYATLNKMKNEGYQIPQIPVVFVKAQTLEKAKRKVLAAASQYGKVNEKGLIAFLGSDFEAEDILTSFSFPEIDLSSIASQMIEGLEEDVKKVTVSVHERSLGEESEEISGNISQVRMVQLFLNGETHPEFMRMSLKLQEIYNTVNLTDTIMVVLREKFNSIQKAN